MGTGAHTRSTASTITGLALIVTGFVAFFGAYFLFPLYVSTRLSCIDTCGPPMSPTTWEFSLRLLSYLEFTPIWSALVLALYNSTLMAAGAGVGFSLAYRARARGAFVVWSTGAWVAGSIALFLMLPPLIIAGRPDWGYLGMALGYGLLWAGSRFLLAAHPQSQVAA